MQRLQIYYPEDLVSIFRAYAKAEGISFAEVLRKAGREFVQKPHVQKVIRPKKMNRKKHSILDMVGIIKGGPPDMSMHVDDIYLDEND